MESNKYSKGAGFVLLALFLCVITPIYGQDEGAFIYRDEKNGYFTFCPPKGWRVQEYNDPRTKVSFNHPDDARIFVRFIVREAPGETFAGMIKADEEMAQEFNAKGIPCNVEQTERLGVPSTKIYAEISGMGYTQLIKFIIFGLHFNIQFASPDKEEFDKYLNEITQSIDSIVVLVSLKPDSEKARRQQIANIVRLAELANEFGDNKNACLILKDGLREFLQDTEIKSKMQILQCDKFSGE